MAAITLVFPHQLFPNHPALCRDREIHLIEDTLYFGDPFASPGRFHQQKILLHRASMKAAADWWSEAGYSVHYHDYYRQTTISEWLKAQAPRLEITEIHLTQCCDYLLEKRIRNTCEALSITVQFYDSPMFLTPHDWADNHFAKRKKPFMAAFYQAQRQRMEILVDSEGKPAGGKWSYDDENRKPMPKRGGLDVPNDPCSTNDAYVAEAKTYVESHFGNYFGSTALFNYAITPEQSQTWLSEFFTWRFDRFGPYEDALSEKERVLFHSMLTPMLNIGLITPEEVVSQALQFAASNDVPLNSLEGFIRQIIGWREFMFQMYQRHGVEMRTSNFWNHQTPLPDSFWNASTGVYPIDLVIERVRDHAWAHHIERLMVLGNFMLLAEFDPKSVNDWFMETFIDAYDWVMVPNVFGMSQFADGGIFTTKPYISGSNYVKKMSDYQKGAWHDTWDALFWCFLEKHREFFASQHRLGMLVRNLDKMGMEKLENFHALKTNLSFVGKQN